MAFSFEQFVGNGSLTNFSFTFPYISQSHVTVAVATVNTAFTWVNATTIQLAVAPASGAAVEVRRTTPKTTALVNFVDAAVLTEADLDTNTQQLLYITQEAFDTAATALLLSSDGHYTAGGFRIKNVGTPTTGTDAANRDYVVGIAMGSVVLPVDAVNITNVPAGTLAATTAQAALNELDSEKFAKTGGVLTGLFTQAAGADIASAATINLTTATGNSPRITGTTATSAVTMNTGQWALVVADAAWPLTYNATTNKLNGGVSHTCVAGDMVLYNKDLSGVVHGYIIKANGTPVVAPGTSGNLLASNGTTWASTAPAPSSNAVYTSAVTPLPALGGAVLTAAHGLSTTPASVEVEVTCLVAEFGFAVGDKITITAFSNGTNHFFMPIWWNATTVGLTSVSTMSWYIHRRDGTTTTHNAMTAASWSYRFRIRPN